MAELQDTGLSFRNVLADLPKEDVTHLIVHHMAHSTWDLLDVHDFHGRPVAQNGRGWAGVGYNAFGRKNGDMLKGRGFNKVGVHASGWNSRSIGLGFQGNFEVDTMPDEQVKAGAKMIKLAWIYLGREVPVIGHGDVGATACPGRNFRLQEMIDLAKGKSIESHVAYKPESTSSNAKQDDKAITPKLYLPANGSNGPINSWRIYQPEGPYTAGSSGELRHKLNPAKFNGLSYDIVGSPAPDVYHINTRDFGKVAIYAGSNTAARVEGIGNINQNNRASNTRTLHLPASATQWRVYNVNGPYSAANNDQVGLLRPSRFNGGLSYEIKREILPHLYEIQTRDFGRVAIFADPSRTSARIS